MFIRKAAAVAAMTIAATGIAAGTSYAAPETSPDVSYTAEVVDQAADLAEETPAQQGELDAAPGAVEQAHAQRALHLRDRLGHGWLGHVQALGGTAEMQFLGHGDELAPGPQVDRKVFHTPSISIGH